MAQTNEETLARINIEIGRGYEGLVRLTAENDIIREKLSTQEKEMMSLKKDIEFMKEMMNEKFSEIKIDMNGVGDEYRKHKENTRELIISEVKKGNLATRLYLSGVALLAIGQLVLFLLGKI